MDQDLFSKALNCHGHLLLQTILGETNEPKNESERDRLQICQFIKHRMKMLFKLPDQLPNGFPEHSVPIVPIEMFRDASPDERRDIFYKSLDRGHILILRVINDVLPDNYKLLVLCKQENHMKLDDLSIVMYLPKLPAELELAGGELQANNLIRAAVCSCSIDERKLYVTLDSNILDEGAENIHLGKISEKDLPFYVGDVDLGPSYVGYLNNMTNVFSNTKWSDDLHRILDLEKQTLYSFVEYLDGKKYDPIVYASELRQKQISIASNSNYKKGLDYYQKRKFQEALSYFNKALHINPQNIEALVSRGILYSNTNHIRRALKDMEDALKINPKHVKASKQMSNLLLSVAKTHIEHNDLIKAKESLEAALFVDSTNKIAVTAYEEFQVMNIAAKSSDKPIQASGSENKDRGRSCSSDRSDGKSSKKGDSKGEQESINQNFNLQVATKKFLSRDRGRSCSSDRSDGSSSKKGDSKGEQENINQSFNLQVATKKFLSSMQKKEQEKDKASHHHRPHFKSRSKSPKSN